MITSLETKVGLGFDLDSYQPLPAALRAFRIAVRNEKGDKQAYLITDAEPTFEDGKQVEPEEAIHGVIEEALRYRQEGITLNIIMLEQSPYLKQIASTLARESLGRVFFTSPLKLGEMVIEDYLKAKKCLNWNLS